MTIIRPVSPDREGGGGAAPKRQPTLDVMISATKLVSKQEEVVKEE